MTSNEEPKTSARRGAIRWRAAALASVLTVSACGGGGASTTDPTDGGGETAVSAAEPSEEIRLTVVTSDPPIADLVDLVAGDGVRVVSVVPMGADGHTYEPVPSDARTLAEADIYIENGMGLNNVVTDFAVTNYPDGTRHFALGEIIPQDQIIYMDTAEEIAAHGHPHLLNAHFWPDPGYAILYVERIAEILGTLDQPEANGYQERAAALIALLEEIDTAFATALATIPPENRKLIVYHDSWSYYGRRYGIPVIGAIQPTDFAEPSAAEVRETIEQVRAEGVPAFFGSEVFPSSVLETIEAETGARYVADLSDDAFPGEPGSPEHSYVGMMIANTRAIVTALGGDPSALDTLPLAP